MRFGSVCSGIEAASVAFERLGWSAAWLAEIEQFPSEVLAHHYPSAPNLGDMTGIAKKILTGDVEAPEVLCGGTPCQAFSVAGLRESLSDDRGNLTLKFVELADAIDFIRERRGAAKSIVLWENVPGVLSTKDNAFGCFLAGLAGEDEPLQPPGKRWENAGAVYGPSRAVAWRTLDAQYFGLAQRRRRVFVVASARDGFDPATVLFEWEGLRRDSPPSREEGEGVAPTVTAGAPSGGPAHGSRSGSAKEGLIVPVMCVAHGQGGAEISNDRSPTLTCNHEAPIIVHGTQDPCVSSGVAFAIGRNNGGENCVFRPREEPFVSCIPFDTTQITSGHNYSRPKNGDPCHPIAASAHPPAVAFTQNQRNEVRTMTVAGALAAAPGAKQQTYIAFSEKTGGDGAPSIAPALRGEGFDASEDGTGRGTPLVAVETRVRRLMPVECERLQGFPDGYTQIQRGKRAAEECADGPRYKALGNSWAVPCAAWIGSRIKSAVEAA